MSIQLSKLKPGTESAAEPRGFWCRACGVYLSTRTQKETTAAHKHTEAHRDAGEQPKDGRDWFVKLTTVNASDTVASTEEEATL